MNPQDPTVPEWAALPDVTVTPPARRPQRPWTSGIARTVATGGLAIGLLLIGGVAAVSAASPDPSAPAATAQPGGSGAPSGGTGSGGTRADCPNM
jgi:hypothetical protein